MARSANERAFRSPPRRGGVDRARLGVRLHRSFVRTTAPVLAPAFAPEFCDRERRESEGGAGRRGPDGPTGLRLSRNASGTTSLDQTSFGFGSPQVRHFSDV